MEAHKLGQSRPRADQENFGGTATGGDINTPGEPITLFQADDYSCYKDGGSQGADGPTGALGGLAGLDTGTNGGVGSSPGAGGGGGGFNCMTGEFGDGGRGGNGQILVKFE
ncbi:MAG: hypothetical protein EOP05_01160 [Proteobacteria bacterium]|nr:MAG: hypothetical protein EOP05_01160 [Pseudomonadota bacterium]